MGMRESKIRFSDNVWAVIQQEAAVEGVSAAQFVREAALMRAVFSRTHRKHQDTELAPALYVEMRRILNGKDPPGAEGS